MAHPDEPWEPASQKIRHQHLDLTIAESAIDKDPFRETQLEAIALRIRQVVVPFLDTLGRYEFATDVLEHGIGVPPMAELIEGGMYSNDRGRVLALLARAHASTDARRYSKSRCPCLPCRG